MACIASQKTSFEADSVECNPKIGSNLFACGKYHLDEKSNRRIGGISLYELDDINSSLTLKNSMDRAGVLDCSWDNKGNNIVTAEADGKIGLFSLNDEDNLQYSSEFNIGLDTISLAIDWNCKDEEKILGSFSDGNIVLCNVNKDELGEQNRFIAHENAEVWAVAYSKHSPFIFYSGKHALYFHSKIIFKRINDQEEMIVV